MLIFINVVGYLEHKRPNWPLLRSKAIKLLKSRLTMLLHSIKRGKTIHKIFSIENNAKIEGKCAKFSQMSLQIFICTKSFVWTLIAIVLPVQFNFLTSEVSVLQVAHSAIRRQAAIYPLVQLKYVKFLLFVNRQYQRW